MDYTSDEEEPDPISTDSPLNSSIEFELGDFFPAMATNYNAPTTSSASYALELSGAENLPTSVLINYLTSQKKGAENLVQKNKRQLIQLYL